MSKPKLPYLLNTLAGTTGFIYEHGPFEVKFAKGSKRSQHGRVVLHSNANSWSKKANIIYLDSPAGLQSQLLANQLPEYHEEVRNSCS